MRLFGKYYKKFPIEVSFNRNPHFFAKIDWFLFKYFKISRQKPCGQNKDHLYCAQPTDLEHCFLSEDKHEIICKCCGTTHVLSSEKLSEKDFYSEPQSDFW